MRKALAAYVLAAAVVVLDAGTKTLIVELFRLGERVEITTFFNLVYWRNSGAAFSFLSEAGGWQRWFFVAIGLAVSAWLVREISAPGSDTSSRMGYGLILGGALGNLIDRLFRGEVVDWLDFYWRSYHWPAFNLADSALVGGIGLLLIQGAFSEQREPRGSGRAPARPTSAARTPGGDGPNHARR